MIRHMLAIGVLLAVTRVQAEYVWTGTEWKWQEPGNTEPKLPDTNLGGGSSFGGGSSVVEGSGGGDNWDDEYEDEEDYEDYTYDDYDKPKKDKKKNKNKGFGGNDDWGKSEKKNKKNRNKNKGTGILPATDDEDFVEGSGSSGFEVPKAQDPNPWDNNFNNNNNWNNNPVPDNNNNWNTPDNSWNNPGPDNNGNVYDVDEEYDDDYYDYKDEDDDISFTGPGPDSGNSWGNVQVDTTPRANNPIINLDNANNNVWNTPSTTVRSYTPRVTTTTTTFTPEIVTSSGGSGSGPHRTVPVNRPASFFAQPGILAAVIGGAVVGLLCAILLVMFIVYRMRKKDEGSYALDEPKRSHNVNSYSKNPSREFYA